MRHYPFGFECDDLVTVYLSASVKQILTLNTSDQKEEKMNEALSRLAPILKLGSIVSIATIVIAAGVVITAVPNLLAAQTAEDSVAIRARVEAYRNAWNTHESAAVAEFFTKDADFVMGNLPVIRGQQAVDDWWQEYFARQEPERSLTLLVNSVRLVAANVALVNITTTTGGQDTQGEKLPNRKFRGTWVLHQQDGAWLISAMVGLPTIEDSVVLTASPNTAESLRPALRIFVDAYQDAFNTHDPSAVTAFYQNDADIIVRNGPLIHGSQAIEDWWREYFSKPVPYRELLVVDEISKINPDIALLNVVGAGVPLETEGGQSSPRFNRAIWVAVREAGHWLIAALRILPTEDDRIIRNSRR